MFQLELQLDGHKEIRQSASQQSLIRDVTSLFALGKDSGLEYLPWSAQINALGQLVILKFDSNEHGLQKFLVNTRTKRVLATIRKSVGEELLGSYVLPEHLCPAKDGKAWAAIKDGAVVDMVYMRESGENSFKVHRASALQRLEPQGLIKDGEITSNKFVPRSGRPLRDRS